jgi:hypothetical protein
MSRVILSGIAALAAALVAPQVFSQQEQKPSQASYTLLQLTVKPTEVGLADFRARAKAIRSCDQAVKLASELGAELVGKTDVRADQLPSELQTIMMDLPVGHATPVYGYEDKWLRVLVLCNRI